MRFTPREKNRQLSRLPTKIYIYSLTSAKGAKLALTPGSVPGHPALYSTFAKLLKLLA